MARKQNKSYRFQLIRDDFYHKKCGIFATEKFEEKIENATQECPVSTVHVRAPAMIYYFPFKSGTLRSIY